MLTLTQIVIRLLLSGVLSAVIGLEREIRHRPAGIRTITLIGVGSTLIMLISLYFVTVDGGDPSRLAAGLMTGICILGTGVIIRGQESEQVQGITTAATIFIVGGIGLAVGVGMYVAAVFAALLTLASLIVFDSERISRKLK